MKPFLKWAGGKYKILDKLQSKLLPGSRLIEPFTGSGAVFLNVNYDSYLLADSNKDLIDLFQAVQSRGAEFVDYAGQLFTEQNNTEAAYYRLRAEFNTTQDAWRKSALFVYLNKHCFNGLCRYNAKGCFNVPYGWYAKPALPAAEILNFSERAVRAEFVVADFKATMIRAVAGDMVYCDPPYVPLDATANFTSYTAEGFGLQQQQELATAANELAARGVNVLVSNHATDLTRELYAGAQVTEFEVQRFISCKGENRKKVKEILAFFPAKELK